MSRLQAFGSWNPAKQTESGSLWLEWVTLVDYLYLSPLLAGGAIPNSKYKSSTLLFFRHHVTDRNAWFSSGHGMILLILELHTQPYSS